MRQTKVATLVGKNGYKIIMNRAEIPALQLVKKMLKTISKKEKLHLQTNETVNTGRGVGIVELSNYLKCRLVPP